MAMKGTTRAEKRAMRCMPPKMMASVMSVRVHPTYILSMPIESDRASHRVLLCTVWLAMPKVMVMSTAKVTPIQRRPRP